MVIKRLILSLVCLVPMIGVVADNVSSDVAKQKAQEMMAERVPVFAGTVSSITPVQYHGKNVYYVVQFVPEGWALISADDKSTPLLGYSGTGVFQTEGQPENVSSFLGGYGNIVEKNALEKEEVNSGWATGCMAKAKSISKVSSEVSPLIRVNWNQTSPYNKYCPSDNQHGKAIVGCVAVAMAQAMSVDQYPARPSGAYSYTSDNYGSLYIDYDKEAAYDWSHIISSDNVDKDDIAHLLFHCGVSINMDYGKDGSGTQDSYIVTALQRNFSYPKSVAYYARKNYSGDWEELIINELKNGRAVCLSGQDLKGGYGHCFNLDGYSNGAYHVNWGWGGSNNGYFMLDGLKDGTMNMDYSDPYYQSVIVGIRAPSVNPSDIVLSNYTVTEGLPAGAVVGSITVESEASNPAYTYKLVGEYSIVFHKYLTAPFNVVNGNLVTTESLNSAEGNRLVTITATNTQTGASVSRDFTIQVLSSTGVKENLVTTESTVEYYNIAGEKLSTPRKGINIIKHVYADGSSKVEKVYNN